MVGNGTIKVFIFAHELTFKEVYFELYTRLSSTIWMPQVLSKRFQTDWNVTGYAKVQSITTRVQN